MSTGVIPGGKAVGAMKLKSSPSNAKFNNEWRNIYILFANLHGEGGETFILIIKPTRCTNFSNLFLE